MRQLDLTIQAGPWYNDGVEDEHLRRQPTVITAYLTGIKLCPVHVEGVRPQQTNCHRLSRALFVCLSLAGRMERTDMAITRRMLTRVYSKTKGCCAYCGVDLSLPGIEWEVEHITPKSRGGTDDYDNLIASCSSCNRTKRCKTPTEFKHEYGTQLLKALDQIQTLIWSLGGLSGDTKLDMVQAFYELSRRLFEDEPLFYFENMEE